MVQDDSHPVANRKEYENRSGYGRQGERKEAARANGCAQEPPSSHRQGSQPPSSMSKTTSTQAQGIIGSANIHQGPSPTQVPSSQLGSQPQSFGSKPISTQVQGEIGSASIHQGPSPTLVPSSQKQRTEAQSFMSKPNSTHAQGKIESSTIHQGPYPTQVSENQPHNSSSVNDGRSAYNDYVHKPPPSEEGRNQPQQSSYPPPAKYHGLASTNDNESIRKPYDDTLPSHGGIAHHQPTIEVSSIEDGHDSDHRNWKSGDKRLPKNVPSKALQYDHFDGGTKPDKLQTGNENSHASPPDKPRIQVNVNVYYDPNDPLRVNSAPHQPTPPRQPIPPAPAPSSAPVKRGSSCCCSIL